MIYYVFSFFILAFSFATTFASDSENGDPRPNAVPMSVLRTYPHLKGHYDAMDAAAVHGGLEHQSDEDTGYETNSRGLSSQSSLLAQIGSQTPSPHPEATVPPMPFNAPEDYLLAQIHALSGKGALLFSKPEQGALSDMGALVRQKRLFTSHLRAYMKKHFSGILDQRQLEQVIKTFIHQIRYNQQTYFKKKKAIFSTLRRRGLSLAQITQMDEKIIRPYENSCRKDVQRCAVSIDIFGEALSPVKRLKERRKLASHDTINDIVLRLDSILNAKV